MKAAVIFLLGGALLVMVAAEPQGNNQGQNGGKKQNNYLTMQEARGKVESCCDPNCRGLGCSNGSYRKSRNGNQRIKADSAGKPEQKPNDVPEEVWTKCCDDRCKLFTCQHGAAQLRHFFDKLFKSLK